eukprot:793705-Pyramimonas_sp.AAC.1
MSRILGWTVKTTTKGTCAIGGESLHARGAMKCRAASWIKVKAWSCQSRDQVLCCVKHHLMVSSHHYLTDESASLILDEE